MNGKAKWELTDENGKAASVDVTGVVTGDDMSFVRKAVLAGCGIGVLPTFICARAELMGKLVRVLGGWSLNGAVLHIAYPSARFVPQRVAVLREYLVSELGNVGKACDKKRVTFEADVAATRARRETAKSERAPRRGVSH
jgi:DNA-binding transcriptional LysR family regulator